MNMKKFLIVILTFIVSCTNDTLDSKKKRVDELKNSLVEIYSEIDMLEEEISLIDSTFGDKNYELVTTIEPSSKEFIHEINLRGNVVSMMNIMIVSEVIGKYKRIFVKDGQFVKKGDVLATINSDVIDINLKEIETNLILLKTIYDRQSNLWDNKIGSEIDYLRAKSNYESIKSRFEATKRQIAKFKITAPFSGIIESTSARVGEMSSPGVPAFSIYNENDSYIEIDVSENYGNSFTVGDNAKLILENDSVIVTSILSVGQVINPINRTFKIGVEIPFDLKESLKPNQIINLKLIDYRNENSISIPSNIIYSDERGNYIFIIDEFDGENVARKIPILIGKSSNYMTEVLSGLLGEEQVIDKGSSNVVDGSYVTMR
tara:strand:+ start:4965 stop:6089 length:1125 start_codon:yes stop_codon:yes gene_type:complete